MKPHSKCSSKENGKGARENDVRDGGALALAVAEGVLSYDSWFFSPAFPSKQSSGIFWIPSKQNSEILFCPWAPTHSKRIPRTYNTTKKKPMTHDVNSTWRRTQKRCEMSTSHSLKATPFTDSAQFVSIASSLRHLHSLVVYLTSHNTLRLKMGSPFDPSVIALLQSTSSLLSVLVLKVG